MIETILNILIEFNISADELLLIYLTLCAQDSHSEYFATWFDGYGKDKLKSLFESLKSKGIIHKNYNPKCYKPDEIEFNKNFIKKYFKQAGVIGKELFEAYEPFLYINGSNYSLRNISKKFYSLEEFYFHYSKTIGHSIKTHEHVMEMLSYAKENKLIKYGILEWVASAKWLDIKYLIDNNIHDESTSNTDNLITL